MICPKCKKQIDDDSKFCEFCGSKIDIKENRSDEYNKKIKELFLKINKSAEEYKDKNSELVIRMLAKAFEINFLIGDNNQTITTNEEVFSLEKEYVSLFSEILDQENALEFFYFPEELFNLKKRMKSFLNHENEISIN